MNIQQTANHQMQLTYLSHSCIKLQGNGICLLVDPFLTGNSTAPVTWAEAAQDVTHILLTHGHSDHVGDTVAIAKKNNIPVIAIVELAAHLAKQGVTTKQANFGGNVPFGEKGKGTSVTFVPAWHTSATDDGQYLGQPAGLVIEVDGQVVYHAGDTSIFGDMALINELYQPTVVLLPIGGTYTMDAETAALAAKKYFSKAHHFIPIHYATFPALIPNADPFTAACTQHDLTATVLTPGQTLAL